MAQWLVKEEPEHYGYDQLERDRKTVWAGVRNPLAQKHLRTIRKGDRIFYYHTGKEKAVVAIARASSDAYPDPSDAAGKLYVVDITPDREAGAAGDARGDQGRPRVRVVSAGQDVTALRDARHRRRVDANRKDE